MVNPTQLMSVYRTLAKLPGGRRVFSKAVGRAAPYTGTLPFLVEHLEPGFARVRLYDRKGVRNHLNSLHAIALMNLGEVSTGLAMYSTLPPSGRGIITDLGMSYVKKARGRIIAECHAEAPSEPGRSDVHLEAILRNTNGVEVARARACWRVDI